MSGIISLESSIRTCKVDAGYANRIRSDRFLNPQNAVCPVWSGLDAAGRVACPYSFKTKSEGCNSANDRVVIENAQRPDYMAYISDSLGSNYNNNSQVPDKVFATQGVSEGYAYFGSGKAKVFSDVTGSAGHQLHGLVWPRTCGYDRYDRYSDSVLKK